MSEIKEYKCPSCGAPLVYDIGRESMSCKFCNNTYDLDYVRSHFNEVTDEKLSDFDWVTRTKFVWEPYEVEKLEEFECSSCGGKIVTWSSTATARCPYCRHDVIVSSDFEGDMRPDMVIPFKVAAEEFRKSYTDFITDLKFIPKYFKDETVLDNIAGFYVPVWSYSCSCTSSFSMSDHLYKESIEVRDFPILANETNIRKDVFYSVWPFSFREADKFTASCLTGFYASRYNVGAENAMERTDPEIKHICSVRVASRAAMQYEAGDYDPAYLRYSNKESKISDRELTYYLVPIWLLNIPYKNKTYTFAMNGQTGKMRVDKLPTGPSYKFSMLAIFLLLYVIEILIGAYVFRSDNIMDTIVSLIGFSLTVFPTFNFITAFLIHRKIFNKTLHKLELFDNQKYFQVDDFVE